MICIFWMGLFFFLGFLNIIAAIRKENRSANKRIFFANFTLEEAFPGPVKKSEIVAVNDEPRRASVGLDDIFGLRVGVFEAGGGVFDDGLS